MPNQGESYVLPDGQILPDNALSNYDPGLADVAQVQAEVQAYPKIGATLGGAAKNVLSGFGDLARASIAGSEQAAANQLGRPFSEKLALGENVALGFGPQTFTGYHGTPHLFDKFSNKAIGSGEGAQAYGYGHYVAGNPKTAEMYKEAVTLAATGNNILSVITKRHPDLFSRIEAEAGGDPWNLWEPRRKLEQLWDAHNYGDPAKVPNLFSPELTRDLLGSGALTSPPGHLLEINVKPDEHELLDWDKPLLEQPHVMAALEKIDPDLTPGGISKLESYYDALSGNKIKSWNDITGQHLYRALASKAVRAKGPVARGTQGSDELASQMLHNAGIPGIKYLDQGSRKPPDIAALEARLVELKEFDRTKGWSGVQNDIDDVQRELDRAKAWKPTSNYVIFDPKNLEIRARNGVPLVPVDHDPFTREPELAPVEHDPFSRSP